MNSVSSMILVFKDHPNHVKKQINLEDHGYKDEFRTALLLKTKGVNALRIFSPAMLAQLLVQDHLNLKVLPDDD